MRVAQLLPALNDGGVERSTVDMAQHLSAAGVENWVISAGGRLVEQITATGATHVHIDVGAKTPWGVWRAARKVARFADANQITILHARSRAPAWAAWFASRWARCKPVFLTTYHGVYGHQSALKRWYNSVMLRGPLVIANSRFVARHIASTYDVPPNRTHIAQRGVDVARFRPDCLSDAAKRQLRSGFNANDGAMLTLVSRVSRLKGHAVLIEALETLLDRRWTMVFVGGFDTPALRDELIARVAAGPAKDRILFTGSRSDVTEILAASDLAFSVKVQPEAFGRAVIEAGASGVPVIATAHGGSLETVIDGRTGWLVPPGDVAALADQIAAALDAPDQMAAAGRAGRDHIVRNFAIDVTIAQEAAAYDLVTQHGRSR
jgi:glycosyltransferase involved in cell wall biosynthesis